MRAKASLLSPLLTVGLPVFRSELRRRALGATTLLAGLLLLICGLNVASNYVTGAFMTALAHREERRFYARWPARSSWSSAARRRRRRRCHARYIEERLGLRWRDWLTRHFLHRYLHDHAYTRLVGRDDVDNPDQRISEDVKTFTTSTLSILIPGLQRAARDRLLLERPLLDCPVVARRVDRILRASGRSAS